MQLSPGSNYRCLNCGVKINGGENIAGEMGVWQEKKDGRRENKQRDNYKETDYTHHSDLDQH